LTTLIRKWTKEMRKGGEGAGEGVGLGSCSILKF
jgi:hypothetical protein